ncbi:hypothetical protein [Pilimelia anulata]|nr:hypothetical protein [Pilimelia anulata]
MLVALAPPPHAAGSLAAADPGVALSGITLVLVVLGVFTAYGLGFAHATLRRARKDYAVTRKALPTLRKGIYNAFTTTFGRLILVAAVVAATMAWSASHGSPT